VLTWSGREPERGLYFTGPTDWAPDRAPVAWTQCQDEDAHAFLPCHDHPGVKHPWRIEIEGPAGYTLLSNGALVEQHEEGGRSFATWLQEDPMPAYLFTIVCAPLERVESTWRDRPVHYLVPAGETEAAERVMGRTPEMMEVLSERVGVPYPWPRYDQVVVHDFVFGGMENTACTTMTELLLTPEWVEPHWQPESLVFHELAHQWFGNLVTCQDWSQGWLNESWATYMEAIWWEETRDEAETVWYRYTTMRQYFRDHDADYRRPIVSYHFREPIDLFDTHLYHKGSCVLWTLRAQMGDEAFWSATKNYLNARRHKTAHTRDFQRAMEEASGQNLDGFFHQWIHSAGHPILKVKVEEEDGLVLVSVEQQQKAEDVPEAFSFGLPLELVGEGGSTWVTLPVTEPNRTWAIPYEGDLSHVRVDPGLSVLAQIDIKASRGMLAKLAMDPCPVLAWRAARGLLSKDRKGRALALEVLGNHPRPEVRAAIAQALSGERDDQTRDTLLQRLEVEESVKVRRQIIASMGHHRHRECGKAVAGIVTDAHADPYLQGEALEALGRLRAPGAVEVLSGALGRHEWACWRWQKALLGLGWTREEEALEIVLRHLEGPERVQSAAAIAMGRLAAHLPERRIEVRERLVECLQAGSIKVQLGAVQGLVTLGDVRALGALDKLRTTAADGRVMRMAYEAGVRIRRRAKQGSGDLKSVEASLEKLREAQMDLRSRMDRVERVKGDES
jgi:aminopeptidase N